MLQHGEHGGLTGLLKQIRRHHPQRREHIGRQVALGRQAGRPGNHGLQGRQLAIGAQGHQQLGPLAGIGGIGQHPRQGDPFAGHRLDQVGRQALLLQQADEPLAQELAQVRRQGDRVHLKGGKELGPMGAGALQQGHQVEAPALVPQDLQQAIAGPAQGVGVRGPTGPLPLGIDAQQQLQPFGQGHHRTGLRRGQAIASAPGQVVLEHGQGHGPGFALRQQVFAAHHPLELGEFAHHLADQVVLAKVGGAAGVGGVLRAQAQLLNQSIGAPLEPLDPVEQAAEPLGEGDPR